jgi:hypothetical protein
MFLGAPQPEDLPREVDYIASEKFFNLVQLCRVDKARGQAYVICVFLARPQRRGNPAQAA